MEEKKKEIVEDGLELADDMLDKVAGGVYEEDEDVLVLRRRTTVMDLQPEPPTPVPVQQPKHCHFEDPHPIEVIG